MPEGKDYLTVEEVKKEMGVHHNTVLGWIQRGTLRAVMPGGVYRINRDDFEEFKKEMPNRRRKKREKKPPADCQ